MSSMVTITPPGKRTNACKHVFGIFTYTLHSTAAGHEYAEANGYVYVMVEAMVLPNGTDVLNISALTQRYYEGTFSRIAQAYDIDYYWLWCVLHVHVGWLADTGVAGRRRAGSGMLTMSPTQPSPMLWLTWLLLWPHTTL